MTRSFWSTSLILFLIFFLPDRGKTDDSHFRKMCGTKWFVQQTKETQKRNGQFFFVSDSSFRHQSQEYALGVIFPNDISPDAVHLVFLKKKNKDENYIIISEITIPTRVRNLNEQFSQEGKTSCILPHIPPYFATRIIDLDGNGTPEVVVRTNAVGSCSRCLSEVRVFEKKGNGFKQVIEEAYNNLEMGTGKGLIVESYEITKFGPIPTKKQFYTKNQKSKAKSSTSFSFH